jgi:hypothetical protein
MLSSTAAKFAALFPYALLQPILKNRFEYKVAVLNGVATYITNEPSRVSGSFSFFVFELIFNVINLRFRITSRGGRHFRPLENHEQIFWILQPRLFSFYTEGALPA